MKKQPDFEVLRYQTDDGVTRVEVRMAGETVWLNQRGKHHDQNDHDTRQT